MSAVTKLKTQITKKNNEISEISKAISATEKTLSELKANYDKGKSYVEGLEQALSLIDDEPVKPKDFKIRPGTQLDAIYKLLKSHGSPMHINNICREMGKDPSKSNRQSLTGTIGKLVREDQFFNRPAPGTFGLIEWDFEQDEPILNTQVPPPPLPPVIKKVSPSQRTLSSNYEQTTDLDFLNE